jgi:hemerythrin
MDYFQWTDDLSVNNPIIDRDHLELISLVNELHSAAELGKDRIALSNILDSLFSYTQEHFQREEILMEAISYEDITPHFAQHRNLIDRVVTLRSALAEERSYVALETAELLRFWLTSHIKLSDRKLAAAVRNAGFHFE